MIEVMKGLPDNVLGVHASGQVTGEDYEKVMIPAVEAKLRDHDKVRFLYQVGPEFTGFDAEAMWDDAKVGLKHMTRFDKIAMVTDVDWIARDLKAFGFLMPCEVKCFNSDQLAEAKKWIEE